MDLSPIMLVKSRQRRGNTCGNTKIFLAVFTEGGVKRVDPRPDTLITATPKVGGSRLQASLADPSGCLDGSERFLDSTSRIFEENPM